MDTGASQLAGVVVGGDVQAVILRHHLDASFALLNVDRAFDVRAAVIFQPQVNGNCHVKFLLQRQMRRWFLPRLGLAA
ncbi:hypothetical protein D9M70_629230 [compost metagenome]